jgi:hypothetical protein
MRLASPPAIGAKLARNTPPQIGSPRNVILNNNEREKKISAWRITAPALFYWLPFGFPTLRYPGRLKFQLMFDDKKDPASKPESQRPLSIPTYPERQRFSKRFHSITPSQFQADTRTSHLCQDVSGGQVGFTPDFENVSVLRLGQEFQSGLRRSDKFLRAKSAETMKGVALLSLSSFVRGFYIWH